MRRKAVAAFAFFLAVFSTRTAISDEPAKPDLYVGVGVPFQGIGFFKKQEQRVAVWNLTPISLETPLWEQWGVRASIYTVYSTPVPRKVGEYEFNLELPWYAAWTEPHQLIGFYVGPMAMMQYHDQDSGATLGGPGVTLGYRGEINRRAWYRFGSYFAYHAYLFGPKKALINIAGGESGGLFMGLTLLEAGTTF